MFFGIACIWGSTPIAVEKTEANLDATSRNVTHKSFAVCIVGAPRTMLMKNVHDTLYSTLYDLYPPKDYDAFYYISLPPKELSIKNVNFKIKGHEAQFAHVMRAATQIQFQYDENPPICHSHTAARFWKWGQCAHMAGAYATKHNVDYKILFVFRPDQRWFHYFHKNMTKKLLQSNQWYMQWCHGDCYALPFTRGVHLLKRVDTDMKCCDTKKREPKSCFLGGRWHNKSWVVPVAPEPNEMFRIYVSSHLHEAIKWDKRIPVIGPADAAIIREPNFFKEIGKTPLFVLHDAKNDVPVTIAPRVSPVIEWKQIKNSLRPKVLLEVAMNMITAQESLSALLRD